jgi:MFS family permease
MTNGTQLNSNSQNHILAGATGFYFLWFGQMISLIGSGMTCFAQSIYVYTDMGGSITNLMLLAVMAQLPGIIISPFAGYLVDKWDRRKVMILGDTVAALATLTLRILVVSKGFAIWHMYVIVVVISVANHFQWPAYFATVPLMVGKEKLGRANGMVQAGRSVGLIAAPALAGWAVTQFSLKGVIMFDLGSFLFALITILIIRIPKVPKAEPEIDSKTGEIKKFSFLGEALYGFRYLWEKRGMFYLLILFCIDNFIFAAAGIILLPMALSLGSATMFGTLMSVGGVAALTGGIIMGAWGGPKRRVYGVIGFMLLQSLGLMIIGIRPSIVSLFIGYITIQISLPFVNACAGIIWQIKVPLHIQGRVIAVSSMVTTLGLEVGYISSGPMADFIFIPLMAVGGPLAGALGPLFGTGTMGATGLMYVTLGLLCFGVALAFFANPRLRNLDTEIPDADFDILKKDTAADEMTDSIGIKQVNIMGD